MNGPNDKQWSKRYSWSQCSEPYKTQLDAIGSQWIEGALSNEELAFEAVQMLSEMDAVPGPRDDVIKSQLRILTEAMLGTAERPPEAQTAELRRHLLDHVRLSSLEAGPER